MFVPEEIPGDKDGQRTCGTCLQPKSVDEFYKDGKDSNGDYKYRRDCKECYRITRLRSRQAKRKPAPTPKRGGRRK